MASLQARHQRTARSSPRARPSRKREPGQWTKFAEATKQTGCNCTPLYYVVLRHEGRLVRQPAGQNRKEAERHLHASPGGRRPAHLQGPPGHPFRRVGGQVAQGARRQGDFPPQLRADARLREESFGDVEGARPHQRRCAPPPRPRSGTRTQAPTATRSGRPPAHVIVAPATLAKHLRQFGAACKRRSTEGYATENPVRGSTRRRPKIGKAGPPTTRMRSSPACGRSSPTGR